MPKPRATAATAVTAVLSSPTRRHASARARSVSKARGAIAADVSVHVRLPHRAALHPLDPHWGDRPATRQQMPKLDRPLVMQLGHPAALQAAHQIGCRGDRLLELAGHLRNGEHDEAR